MKTLLLGLSTRALAESALAGGHHVISLDYFGDLDQKAKVENHSLARDLNYPFSADNLFRASQDLVFDQVVYTSNLENHPRIIAALASRTRVLGNQAGSVARIRDWRILRPFCLDNSILHPATLLPGEEDLASGEKNWLLKPALGGGGSGIRPWDGRRLEQGFILQAFQPGLPASAAFVADGKKAVIIGLTSQLIGQSEFGAAGYAWCGNILPLGLKPDQQGAVLEHLEETANRLTSAFQLQGVGGIDFLAFPDADGRWRPCLVEVNPRYTASMELMELAYGLNIFNLHLAALKGFLPEFSLARHIGATDFWGKGIVFARHKLVIPETAGWAGRGWRDIPFANDEIESGRPVCTVFSSGKTHGDCLEGLINHTAMVRMETGDLGEGECKTNLH